MHQSILRALHELSPSLRQRWEVLLRAEPVTSPLASPDSLIYLMNWTLDRVMTELRASSVRRKGKLPQSRPEVRFAELCECGFNPLLAYFTTAERALMEAVLDLSPILPEGERLNRDECAAEIRQALHAIARREIDSFCALCQRKQLSHTPALVGASVQRDF